MLIVLLFTCTCSGLNAQVADLVSINEKRINTNKKAMLVLGGWGAGNLATGFLLMGQADGSTKHFHQMNAGWGAINLGLATFSYLASAKTDPASFNTFQTFEEQHKIQKILLFNAGLDLAYITGGLYLRERSNNPSGNPERLRGFGESIILQGSFLFVFDLAVFLLHRRQNQSLQVLLEGLSFHGNGLGWRMAF